MSKNSKDSGGKGSKRSGNFGDGSKLTVTVVKKSTKSGTTKKQGK